ncbi:MAG: GAF domain-containing SpoIIE family protein phosphatase [Brevinematia bacterium]
MNIENLLIFLTSIILIAFSIDSIVKSQKIVNIISSLIFLVLATILGSNLIIRFFVENGYPYFQFFIKLRDFLLYSFGLLMLVFSIYFPSEKEGKKNYIILSGVILASAVIAFVSFTGKAISKASISYKIDIISPVQKVPYPFLPQMKMHYYISLNYNILHFLLLAFSITTGLLSILLIILKYKKVHLIYQKKQIRYFISGVLAFITIFIPVAIFKSLIPSFLYNLALITGIIISSISLIYSITSYRFANLRKKIINLIKENLLNALIVLPFVIFFLASRGWFSNIPAITYFFIITILLIFFLWFNKITIEFLRKYFGINLKPDLTEILFDRLGHSRNIEELAKNTVNTLVELINIKSASFLSFNLEKDIFETIYSFTGRKDKISALNPIFRYVTKETEFFDKEVINIDPKYNNIKEISNRYFDTYETALMLPLFFDNTLIAIINIEYKIDNNSFTKDEIEILLKLKKVCTLILHNIILFEKEENAKITKRDLVLASNIQEAIFQSDIPSFKGMDIYAFQKPAKEVSGDYFFIQKISENKAGFIIADVSGKGFSAALVSMMIHTVVQSQEFSNISTGGIVLKINEVMTSNQTTGKVSKTLSFATVLCGEIDKENGILDYTSAGHHPALMFDINKNVFNLIKSTSRPAGIFKDELFPSRKIYFDRDQIFVFYTDGVTEATNNKEEEFGLERLKEVVIRNKSLTAKQITEKIIEAVENFVGEEEQFDDITLMVIKL